jgi:hypothetical protein
LFRAERGDVQGTFVEGPCVEFGMTVFEDHGGSDLVVAVGAWQEF